MYWIAVPRLTESQQMGASSKSLPLPVIAATKLSAGLLMALGVMRLAEGLEEKRGTVA